MTFTSISDEDDHIQAIEAARTVERVVGIAWATDKAGEVIYLTGRCFPLSDPHWSNSINRLIELYMAGQNLSIQMTSMVLRQYGLGHCIPVKNIVSNIGF